MKTENVLRNDLNFSKVEVDEKNITEENGKFYTIIEGEKHVFVTYLNAWVGLK